MYKKVCQWRSSAGPGLHLNTVQSKKGIYVQLFNIADDILWKSNIFLLLHSVSIPYVPAQWFSTELLFALFLVNLNCQEEMSIYIFGGKILL